MADRPPRSDYRAPAWLPGGHLQTIWGGRLIPAALPRYRREQWPTPDGDEVALDWIDGPADAPLLALFHGLEGSSASRYARSIMAEVRRRGWSGVVLHFRGCGGTPNRLPRAYHSGDSAEIDWMLRRLRNDHPDRPMFAAGISLGGNALLKWLGEQGPAARPVVDGAASVCAPLDLLISGDHLGRGFNRVYTAYFLGTLKPKALAKLARWPGLFPHTTLRRARNLREFDNCFTAPLHGFRDTDDYWTRASSRPWLPRIALPTLVLNSRNDPFVPHSALPDPAATGPFVTLEWPDGGGHVGFVSGAFPGHLRWLPQRLMRFFEGARRPPHRFSENAS